jgi:hypothetical protein
MQKPVGELLKQWQSYLTNISSNLMELSDQIEYQIIKSRTKASANGFTGVTKQKAEQCVESVGALWRYFALLTEVYEKANGLYSKSSFLNNTEDEVRQLLETTEIVVETERLEIHQRSLISSENKEKKAKPGELLKYMQQCFEDVCSTVAEISKASVAVDARLSNIRKDISTLNAIAKRFGVNGVPEFDISRISEIENNPLQGSAELDKVVYSLEKYRASIESVEADYNNIVLSFGRIREMILEIRHFAIKSKKAVEMSRKLFRSVKVVKPIVEEEIIKSLLDWLSLLEKKLSEGQLKAVKIGVSNLEKECLLKLNLEKDSYYENSKDYNDWLDLKGQFKALCAKAEALSIKGQLGNISVNEQISITKAALYSTIVDLDKCRQLVRKFEVTLKK